MTKMRCKSLNTKKKLGNGDISNESYVKLQWNETYHDNEELTSNHELTKNFSLSMPLRFTVTN